MFGLAIMEPCVKAFTMAFQYIRIEESFHWEDTEMTLWYFGYLSDVSVN